MSDADYAEPRLAASALQRLAQDLGLLAPTGRGRREGGREGGGEA